METVGTIPVGDRKLGIAEVTHGGPVLLGPKKWQPRVYFHDVSCSMVKISVFKGHFPSCFMCFMVMMVMMVMVIWLPLVISRAFSRLQKRSRTEGCGSCTTPIV